MPPPIVEQLPHWDGVTPAPLMARHGEYGANWMDEDDDEQRREIAREQQRQMQRTWKARWREKQKCKPHRT
jgi:hypothetical protein